MTRIDLNCDVGERPDLIADGTQDALMDHVSSVNVACGAHAGDEATMEATVRAALRRGLAIGAHPGYPDREGFGRRALPLGHEVIAHTVYHQVTTLAAIAARCGATLRHVKPHGAPYNLAARDEGVARAVARGVARWRTDLVLVGLAGSRMIEAFRAAGFPVAAEAFADRRYEPDGSLRARTHPDALLTDPAMAAAQALGIATRGSAIAPDGCPVAIEAATLCLHGDTPGGPALAAAVAAGLRAAGVEVAPLG